MCIITQRKESSTSVRLYVHQKPYVQRTSYNRVRGIYKTHHITYIYKYIYAKCASALAHKRNIQKLFPNEKGFSEKIAIMCCFSYFFFFYLLSLAFFFRRQQSSACASFAISTTTCHAKLYVIYIFFLPADRLSGYDPFPVLPASA